MDRATRQPVVWLAVSTVAMTVTSCIERPEGSRFDGPCAELRIEPAELVVHTPQSASFSAPSAQRVFFSLKNVGTDALHVTVEAKCGCMAHGVPDPLCIQPGESHRVELQVRPPPYGTRKTSVVIHTDSSRTPEAVVPVVINGPELRTPYVEAVPTFIELSGRQPGELVARPLFIRTLNASVHAGSRA